MGEKKSGRAGVNIKYARIFARMHTKKKEYICHYKVHATMDLTNKMGGLDVTSVSICS